MPTRHAIRTKPGQRRCFTLAIPMPIVVCAGSPVALRVGLESWIRFPPPPPALILFDLRFHNGGKRVVVHSEIQPSVEGAAEQERPRSLGPLAQALRLRR